MRDVDNDNFSFSFFVVKFVCFSEEVSSFDSDNGDGGVVDDDEDEE